MIYEVELVTFESGRIRQVTVPDLEVVGQPQDVVLAKVWYYGQNDFCVLSDQPQQLPSVSMGDVIRLPDGRRMRVLPVGFEDADDPTVIRVQRLG